MYNTLIVLHILMKQLLLQITYNFTKKTYSHYQNVSSDQTAQTTTAPFMSYFINFKDFMYLYTNMFYYISYFNNFLLII